ncbi:hypothetical protein WALSEDRAFT_69496 [Wallemia mellicola CBS 633.66]|uniref:RRM domain-containing protein n=2 Tax=Wallemia mellicola TaxID=1708541 RepID=A0A4T0M3H2_9BASI|nr:hypothetical protein WALSEDRAFT_69496 [Wallemia mellicola CBS 633.66]TIB73770.1 hypothetical protein E3Q24_00907 [Wallemia mellicola]EIM20815.1 hypothetical protein WALSEDRAFT_69496 [Wallemia mellicola CBS 633.66]TIB77231.1 hypothetical protein E3Q23_01416 [Wallemia mellicola]TIB92981.1 hypothetical protein E3Q19_01596 [Wallemia mellicola]TIC01387.1 hypothetical protein E3Q17_01828 [Wallemia mellicola]|eukprot:XP_006959078.1 hypothetical protein WALSEDRAFT_69496 [Wallemia mellicola CBS 633.66]
MLSKYHYKLTNIPSTATLNDIKRLIARSAKTNPLSADSNFQVAFYTSKFPNDTHRANVKFTNNQVRESFKRSLRVFDRLSLSTSQLKCTEITKDKDELNGLTHYQPSSHPGQTVLITGLPGRLIQHDIQNWLRSYHVDQSSNSSQEPITSLHIPSDKFNGTSKWLVRLNSISEAHRLVRNLHQTNWDNQFLIHAKITY